MSSQQQQVRELAALLVPNAAGDNLRLRQGVVAGIGMGRVSIYLDGPFAIGGIPFMSSYVPRVGDVVWLMKNGSDMFVVDKVQLGGITREPWHYVGETQYNEPAFENSWVNYGDAGGATPLYESARFFKDVDEWVHLQGLVRNLSGAAYNTVIFTLPIGYRPATTRRIPVLRHNNEIWQLEIRSDGTVRPATANNTDNAEVKTWISLNGARFKAAGIDDHHDVHEWTPIGYGPNLWTWDTSAATGQTYDYPAFWHRWDGLVRGRGTLAGGNGFIIGFVSERSSRTRYARVFATCTYTGFITIEPARIDLLAHNRMLRTFSYDPNWNDGMALGGIQWFADIPENHWTDLPLVNSWTNYNNEPIYAPAQFLRDGYKEVHLRGVIEGGTSGSNVAFAVLPEGHRPRRRLTFAGDSGSGYTRIDVDPNGNVTTMVGITNSYLSLDSVSFHVD